jgi:hypothetical protein
LDVPLLSNRSGPFLHALAEHRERLHEALLAGRPESLAGRRILLHRFIVVSRVLQTCRTDAVAREALREQGRRGDDLGWAAQQVRRDLGELGAGRDERHGRVLRWPGRRRVLATTAFDSRVQPRFVGLRGVGTPARRAMFQAQDVEIDLEITPSPKTGRVRLAGELILRGPDHGRTVLRLSGALGERLERLDDAGEFWLDELEPGLYSLEIELEDRVVEVPVLEI